MQAGNWDTFGTVDSRDIAQNRDIHFWQGGDVPVFQALLLDVEESSGGAAWVLYVITIDKVYMIII